MAENRVLINQHTISVSKLDKVFWPENGYTKGNLIQYYVEIAPYLLPHLRDRPIVSIRFPDGVAGKHFYQKNAPPQLPEWIETYQQYSQESDRPIDFIVVGETAALAWLANQAVIEIHPWLSRTHTIAYPDFAVIDLDPSPANTYQQVCEIARVFKQLFDELKLKTYVKTSGSEGLHIYLPVKNEYTYQQIRDFTRTAAALVTRIRPDIATIERVVKKRGPRIYLDYLQIGLGKTLSSVYSVRARKGAPVSVPLHWEEITEVTPEQFTIKNIIPRLQKEGDLFSDVLEYKQSLASACEILGLHSLLGSSPER